MDVFWADQLAEEAIIRAKKERRIVTCRGAASPSGGKHIGNLFDAAKAYMVHKAVLKKGYQSRFVFTHDDRDPLRNIPSKLPRLDGKWYMVDENTKKSWKNTLACRIQGRLILSNAAIRGPSILPRYGRTACARSG